MAHCRIPTIDISSWTSDEQSSSIHGDRRQTCARQFERAMSDWGMVIITGHAVPAQLLSLCLHNCHAWFSQTPPTAKRQHIRGPYGCPEGGYTAQGIEAVAASELGKKAQDHVDMIESYVFRGLPPSQNPLSEAAIDYYHHMCRLGRVLHRILCCALGVKDLDHFVTQGILPLEDQASVHSLKLSFYPDQEGESSTSTQLRYGAHTDFQDVTILRPDPSDWSALSTIESEVSEEQEDGMVSTLGGLQVWNTRLDKWQAVCVDDPTALVVNLGDFWKIWSGGRFTSPLHRVTSKGWRLPRQEVTPNQKIGPPSATTTSTARTSLVFFSIPNERATVAALPNIEVSLDYQNKLQELIKANGGKPPTAGEHLAMKLARINS